LDSGQEKRTTDSIFTIKKTQEKYENKGNKLYHAFGRHYHYYEYKKIFGEQIWQPVTLRNKHTILCTEKL